MKKRMTVLALGLVSVLFAGQEAAADIPTTGPMASAVIDWTTLQISTLALEGMGPAPEYSLSNESSYSRVTTGPVTVSDFKTNWDPGTMASSWTYGYGYAAAFPYTVKAEAGLDEMQAGNVSAWSYHSADLMITGTGLLHVMVDYTWKVELVEGQEGEQSADVECSLALQDDNGTHGLLWYSRGGLDNLGNIFVGEESSKLDAYFFVTDGMIVHMAGNAKADVNAAPVPVPPALLLLGSGVFGLFAARRKVQA